MQQGIYKPDEKGKKIGRSNPANQCPWPGGELGVDSGEGTLDGGRDSVEILSAQHRAAVQRGCALLVQLVPETPRTSSREPRFVEG